MKNLKTTILFLLLTFVISVKGQIKVSNIVQQATLIESENSSLYLVEFWATWCAPCINVSKYLNVLQKQNPKGFYILSLSEENPDLIKKFLTKHPTKLAVAIDYDGVTFNKYKVNSLPYAVLLNSYGETVWEGNPSNLKDNDIKYFLKKYKKTIPNHDFIEFKPYKKVTVKKENYLTTSDIEVIKLNSIEKYELQILKKSDYIQLKGALKDIYAYVLKETVSQIEIPKDLDLNYSIFIKKNLINAKNLTDLLSAKLNINLEYGTEKMDAIKFELTSNDDKLWNPNQINWGKNSPQFMVNDSQLLADNATIVDIKYKLSNLIETPILVTDYSFANKVFDWQIHYKFYNLMADDLKDNFGIKVTKVNTKIPFYTIKKGAN